MKKLALFTIAISIASLAQANTFTSGSDIVSSDVTLTGGTAYIYGESVTKQTINTATITFNDIDLTASSPFGINNVLYYDVIDTGSKISTTSFAASEANYNTGQDYFTQSSKYGGVNSAQIGSTLTSWGSPNYFPLNTKETWTTDITGTALTDLEAEIANGYFDIGFNPNCPYKVLGGITLTFSESQTNITVPDQATTVTLLGLTFLGLVAFRRKLCLN